MFGPTNHCCHYPYGCYHENNFTFWLPLRRTNCHLAEEGSSYNGDDKTTKCIRALFTVLLLRFFIFLPFHFQNLSWKLAWKPLSFPCWTSGQAKSFPFYFVADWVLHNNLSFSTIIIILESLSIQPQILIVRRLCKWALQHRHTISQHCQHFEFD